MKKIQELTKEASNDLQELSDEVQKVFEKYGLTTSKTKCRTKCSVEVGPDGKPIVKCELECEW